MGTESAQLRLASSLEDRGNSGSYTATDLSSTGATLHLTCMWSSFASDFEYEHNEYKSISEKDGSG